MIDRAKLTLFLANGQEVSLGFVAVENFDIAEELLNLSSVDAPAYTQTGRVTIGLTGYVNEISKELNSLSLNDE